LLCVSGKTNNIIQKEEKGKKEEKRICNTTAMKRRLSRFLEKIRPAGWRFFTKHAGPDLDRR
jgi:hypothetical protein